MVEVYADGALIYNPYLDGHELTALEASLMIDKGGTAIITMPPGHPAYNAFTGYRTEVTIFRAGELLFRGRALYPADNFAMQRTITCEGERCFLRDAVLPPYLYQASPRVIFADVIGRYNAQVEPWKQFQLGSVTAEDPNDYVRIESEEMEYISDVVDKLVERVGGYITFTTDADGRRLINWLGSLDQESGQAIEFGENLLDFSRTGANTELYTVIYPYGAKDETTGHRVTIESVNDGKAYIEDAAAVALRGRIAQPVYWDDVTKPENLLRKAQQYLATSKLIITTLDLSAVDLSAMDRSIDPLRVGDSVRVRSAPHGVDDLFLLRERSYNLLDPSKDRVVLGKELTTLTGADVTSTKAAAAELVRTAQSLRTDYRIGITDAASAYTPRVAATGDDTGQYMTANGLLLQWGSLTIKAAALSPSHTEVVTFPYVYKSRPAVFVASTDTEPDVFVSAPADAVPDPRRALAAAVTLGDRTEAHDVELRWLAIGRSI